MKLWIAAVLAAALAALASTALAGDVATFDTKVGIANQAPAFHGKLRSDEPACVEDRRVKLLRRTRPGRPARVLGRDKTGRRGRWAITEPDEFTLRSGIYFARAKRKIIKTPLPTICDRGRSKKIFVD
jgi:hypothetical protein